MPIQYADYASWQREWLDGEVLDEQIQYWRRQLAGAPEVLELPTDRERPSVQTFRGGQEKFALDEEVSAALKELSRREGVTMFMLILAAFQLLLMRYSNSEDIVVGTDVAGRRHREVERLIGFLSLAPSSNARRMPDTSMDLARSLINALKSITEFMALECR